MRRIADKSRQNAEITCVADKFEILFIIHDLPDLSRTAMFYFGVFNVIIFISGDSLWEI